MSLYKYNIGDIVNKRKWFDDSNSYYDVIDEFNLTIVDRTIADGEPYYKVKADSDLYYAETWFIKARENIEELL